MCSFKYFIQKNKWYSATNRICSPAKGKSCHQSCHQNKVSACSKTLGTLKWGIQLLFSKDDFSKQLRYCAQAAEAIESNQKCLTITRKMNIDPLLLSELDMYKGLLNKLSSRNRFINIQVPWGASSQWSFCPNFTWGSIETTTIGKTHPKFRT